MARPTLSLKARALRYLSTREHSRIELARKLAPHVADGDDIEQLLDMLEAAGLLSNSRFSESLIHRRAKRFGDSHILAELQNHGIDGADLAGAKAALADGETDRACEIWQRKFGTPARDAAERAKQMRFMLQRGFSHRAIQVAMQGVAVADDDFPPQSEPAD